MADNKKSRLIKMIEAGLDEKFLEIIKTDRKVRNSFFIAIFLLSFSCLVLIVIPAIFNIQFSVLHTLIFRWVRTIADSIIILGFCYFTFHYCSSSVTKFDRVHIENLIFLFLVFIVLFTLLYYHLYSLSPKLFNYQNPFFVPEQVMKYQGLLGYKTIADFLILSASKMTMSSFLKVNSNSAIISLIGIFQSFISLFIIVVGFSSILPHWKSKRKKDEGTEEEPS